MSERAIVCGAGGISDAWFPPLLKERVEIAAIVDLRREAAQAQADKYKISGASISGDLDQTLRDVKADFLVDPTTPNAHCAVTTKALGAGLHVIGEKPMASSMDEARKMVAASEKSGKTYMVSQSRRWSGFADRTEKIISGGLLGDLTALHCDFFIGAHFGGFRDQMASPLILDMAIHHFDLARKFGGRDAISVYAEEFNPQGSWYLGAAAANCLFEMSDGVRFTYRGSWCAEGMHTDWNGNWRAIGTRGTMISSSDGTLSGETVAGDEGFFRPKAPLAIPEATVTHGGQHGAIREFLAFLRGGAVPQGECHDNIKSLAMAFAVLESARRGARVKLSAV